MVVAVGTVVAAGTAATVDGTVVAGMVAVAGEEEVGVGEVGAEGAGDGAGPGGAGVVITRTIRTILIMGTGAVTDPKGNCEFTEGRAAAKSSASSRFRWRTELASDGRKSYVGQDFGELSRAAILESEFFRVFVPSVVV